MNDDQEKQLVEKILSGDFNAFHVFVDQYKRLVLHITFRMIDNASDREDICQDVFVKAYNNLNKFQFRCKLSTWLGRIAYTTCLNYLEKKRVPLLDDFMPADLTVDHFPSTANEPDILVEKQDIAGLIQTEMKAIPVRYRVVLTLFHLENKTYAEIGDILELPEGTVKSYLFRARQYLKDRLLQRFKKEELIL
ncbi:sigma-70 family RNA polymerase sigma factor [candidate division KSB1 bacterium]|nr:sigma-70 family RNA polymerase sigma factor [candidate division KSB1 bacterium]